MSEQMEIMEMSALSKEEILLSLVKMFNQNDIQRFTVIVKQIPLDQAHKRQQFTLFVDDSNDTPTTRPKSSTIDRFYRSTNFTNNLRKSMTTNQAKSQTSFCESQLPDSPKQLGLKFYHIEDYQQAIQIFQELKEDFPLQLQDQTYRAEYRQILNYLGNCHFRLSNYQQAINIYKQFLKQFDGQVVQREQERMRGHVYNNLGCCYGKIGCEKLSMNAYNEALRLYSKYPDIDSSSLFYNIANMYYNCSMHEVAEKYYQNAISERQRKRPQNKALLYHGHFRLSSAQTKQGKYKQALQNLSKALKLAESGQGDSLQVLRQCAQVKQLQEKWSQALEFYEKLHLILDEQTKPQAWLYERVSFIYRNLGKTAQYKKYLQIAIQQYRKERNQRKISELSVIRY